MLPTVNLSTRSRLGSFRAPRYQLLQSALGPWQRGSCGGVGDVDSAEIMAPVIPKEWPSRGHEVPTLYVQGHLIGEIDGICLNQDASKDAWPAVGHFKDDLESLLLSEVPPVSWPLRFQWLVDPNILIPGSIDKKGLPKALTQQQRTELQSFCVELGRESSNNYLFRAGYLPALSRASFKAGDSVWAIDGCQVFLILRKFGIEAVTYKVVGACSLHGMSQFDCYDSRGKETDKQWTFNPFRCVSQPISQIIRLS